MQTGGGGFAGAVSSQDQLVDYKLTIGFPGTVQSSFQDMSKCVVSFDIQQNVTTSLPDGTTNINGYASSAATIVLSGMLNQAAGVALVEAQSAYWLFNPNDSTSPMWRKTRGGLSVVIQGGFWDGASSADLVTKFTGTIDQVTCSNGTVTLVCRDNRSTITNQATLPPVITNVPYNAELSNEFAIDYLARHSSPAQYYSWPKQRPNCVYACGFRSSIWPDVGTVEIVDPNNVAMPRFAPGKWGTALSGGLSGLAPTGRMAAEILPSNTSIFVEFWAGGGFSSTNGGMWFTSVSDQGVGGFKWSWFLTPASNTSVLISLNSASGGNFATINVADTVGIHYYGFWLKCAVGSAAVTGTQYYDNTSTNFSFTAADVRPNINLDRTDFEVTPDPVLIGTIEGFQVTTETAPTPNNAFTPTLILDSGGSLNSLTALPDVSGQDTWSVLQTIAASENAVIGFDELGLLHFTNRQTIKTMTSVRSITSTTSLLNLDSLEQMSLCATHIQVPVNAITIGSPGFIWEATSVIAVSPGVPTVIIINTGTPVVNVPTTDSGFYYAGGTGGPAPVAGQTYWQASTDPGGNGLAFGGGVFGGALTVATTQLSSTVLMLTITNTTYLTLYLVQPLGWPGPSGTSVGAPALYIGGQAINSVSTTVTGSDTTGAVIADSQWPDAANGGAISNTQFGEILLALPQNNWVQDLPSAQTLADSLLRDLHYPKPQYRNVSIVADPRLQLLDRVTLVDPDLSQINDDALIVGIETQLSAGQWMQTIDARAVDRPGAWLLGVAGRSELGVTTYLY